VNAVVEVWRNFLLPYLNLLWINGRLGGEKKVQGLTQDYQTIFFLQAPPDFERVVQSLPIYIPELFWKLLSDLSTSS
jgi:hypothetical protein